MTAHLAVQFDPAVSHRPHQVNAPARTVILIAQFDISRAGRGAQSAMDAVEKQLIIDAGVVLHDRQREFVIGHWSLVISHLSYSINESSGIEQASRIEFFL